MLALYLAMLESDSDKELFIGIYEDNLDKMYSIAKSVLLSHELAKDAVHDTFIKIIDNFEKFIALNNDCRKGWIIITTRNTALNIRRKEKRSFPAGDDYLFNNISIDCFDEDFYDLINAIGDLPKKYRDSLEMRYIYGYSNKEIAEIFNISEDNARKRLYRAKQMLLEKL